MKVAVSTLLLPDLPASEQVALARDLGYDGLALRVADRMPPDAVALRRAADAAALEVCAIATDVSIADPAAFEPLAAGAASAGATMIRVVAPAWTGATPYDGLFESAVAGLDRIEPIARAHGLRAVLDLRPGTIAASASAARRLVEGGDPDILGVSLDPGGMVHEGFEAWDLATAILGPWLAHVSVTNAVWALREKPAGGPYRWTPRPARLREGQADWRAVLASLRAAGYDGWYTLEDVSPEPARAKLDDALALLKALAAPPNTGGADAVG